MRQISSRVDITDLRTKVRREEPPIKNLFEKVDMKQKLSESLILENLISQSSLFKLRHFSTQCLKSLDNNNKQRQNEYLPVTLSHIRNIEKNRCNSDCSRN